VGTFVDTVFMFTYDVKLRKLILNSQMCTHDSIVSIGLGVEGMIVCGQASGFVDLLTWQVSKKANGEYKMNNIAHIQNPEFGYINSVMKTDPIALKDTKNTQTMEPDSPLQFALATA